MERVGKRNRRVIAINPETGEKKEFNGISEIAKDAGVTSAAVCQALDRGGTILGWNVYDEPDVLREKIRKLQETIKMLEA